MVKEIIKKLRSEKETNLFANLEVYGASLFLPTLFHSLNQIVKDGKVSPSVVI